MGRQEISGCVLPATEVCSSKLTDEGLRRKMTATSERQLKSFVGDLSTEEFKLPQDEIVFGADEACKGESIK